MGNTNIFYDIKVQLPAQPVTGVCEGLETALDFITFVNTLEVVQESVVGTELNPNNSENYLALDQ